MNLKTLAVCALALSGCASEPEKPEPTRQPAGTEQPPFERGRPESRNAGAEALAQVDQNLARLQSLDVFEVGKLLVDLPEEAFACYGPCPGSEPAIEAAKEEAALRLAAFADVAEAAAGAPSGYLCTEQVDQNIAALQALAIVEVLGLIEIEPANIPQCYNLPCQDDIDAAKAANELRAAELDSIARGATGL